MSLAWQGDYASDDRRRRISHDQPPPLGWWALWMAVALGMWLGAYYGLGWAAGRFLEWYWNAAPPR
jgi:hypothetical protein